MAPRNKWRPMQKAAWLPLTDAQVAEQARLHGCSVEEARELLDAEAAVTSVFKNDLYQVSMRLLKGDYEGYVHLNIRRVDGGPLMRDWRHFQQIKNELVGEENEAIEIYPAESRKVDTSNKFHLFACLDPTFRFPFGDLFGNKRDVYYEGGSTPGTRQRPE